MTRPAIVFDLDGTLIDSAPDLRHAANAVLAAEGLGAQIEQVALNLCFEPTA